MKEKIKDNLIVAILVLIWPVLGFFMLASGVAYHCTCNMDLSKGFFTYVCTCEEQRTFGNWKWDWWNENTNE